MPRRAWWLRRRARRAVSSRQWKNGSAGLQESPVRAEERQDLRSNRVRRAHYYGRVHREESRRHDILGSARVINRDVDGDGIPDLIAGKRVYAQNGSYT